MNRPTADAEDAITIWPFPKGNQSAWDNLRQLIRTGGIAYKRQHDPDWRDKPYKDGIRLNLNKDDVLAFLTDYIVDYADPDRIPPLDPPLDPPEETP